MKTLTREETRAVAELARLQLSDAELDTIGAELGQILEHMEALAEVDTEGVEPMTHAVPMSIRPRSDEVEASLSAGRAVGAAPDAEDDFFRVPRVIESRGEESS